MDNKEKFMIKAIELSKKSIGEGGGPFGCVIVKDNNIIASDFDSNYSYLMQHKAIMENDYKYLCKFDSGKDILRLIIAAEKSAYTENNNWIRNETNL